MITDLNFTCNDFCAIKVYVKTILTLKYLEGGGTSVEADRSILIQENRQINIQLERLGSRIMAQKGLTAIQSHVLLYILDHSERGISLTDIHREFGYSMAAMSGLVKRLREKDYVRVEPCARDDRKKFLFGTDKGKQVRDFLDCTIHNAQEQLYSGFSPDELSMLDRLQKKMLRNLSSLTQSESKEVPKS